MLDTYSRQKVAGVVHTIRGTFPKLKLGLIVKNFRVRGTRRRGFGIVSTFLNVGLPGHLKIYRYANVSGCTLFHRRFGSQIFCGCAN